MKRRLPVLVALLVLLGGHTACAEPQPDCDTTVAGCPEDDGIELDDFICEPDDHPGEWECRDDSGHVVITNGPPPRAVIRTPKGYKAPQQPARRPDSQTRRDIQRQQPANPPRPPANPPRPIR